MLLLPLESNPKFKPTIPKRSCPIGKKHISSIPQTSAVYTFDANQAKSLSTDRQTLTLEKNYFGEGLSAITNGQFYWKINDIEPEKYYLGLWVQSNSNARQMNSEYNPAMLTRLLFLNGWPIRFNSTSDPIQVKPNVWLLELQTAKPFELKNGDEITGTLKNYVNQYAFKENSFLKLCLYKKEPKRGHGVAGYGFAGPQRQSLVVHASISGSASEGNEHEAKIDITNPFGHQVKIIANWALADYFGAPLVKKSEEIVLPAHKTHMIKHKFTAVGEARAYQLDVKTKAAPGFKHPTPRPFELVELDDWSKMEYLPDLKSPYETWKHERLDLTEINTGNRKFFDITSGWEQALMKKGHISDIIPEKLEYKKYLSQKLPEGCDGKWYRKILEIPQITTDERTILDFHPQTMATVFVNGQKAGTGFSDKRGCVRVKVDITDFLDFGKRLAATKSKGECIAATRERPTPSNKNNLTSKSATNTLIIAIQKSNRLYFRDPLDVKLIDAKLCIVPNLRVAQTVVLTQPDKNQIRVMSRVTNSSKIDKVVDISYDIFQEGKPTNASLKKQKVHVPAGSQIEVESSGSAGDLKTYTTKTPILAKLQITLSENGNPIDQHFQRFGYRSLQVDKNGLLLNGKPTKLFGGFQHGKDAYLEQNDAITVSRDPYGGNTLDFLDEVGKFHYPFMGVGFMKTWVDLNDKHRWDIRRQMAIKTIWDIGSHPCVIGLAISNESYHYAQDSSGVKGQEKHGELIYSIAEAIRNKFNYPFWCIADGDEDLGGRLDFCSFHYANHHNFHGYLNSATSFGYFFKNGHSHYSPDCYFLNKAKEIPKTGTILKMRPDWTYGSKPCGDTESFYTYGCSIKTCKYIGDQATVSSACFYDSPRGIAWMKTAIDAYRDMEQAFVSGMYWKPALRIGVQSVSLAMPEREIRYFSGAMFDRRINLHDDEFLPGNLCFSWKLIGPDKDVVKNGISEFTSGTSTIKRERLAFSLPEVREKTEFTLTLTLNKDGRKRSYEERIIEVWPKKQKSPVNPTIITVFDPSGKVIPILKKMGYNVVSIEDTEQTTLTGKECLVIGPDCIENDMKDMNLSIQNYAQNGGRVIVLHQNSSALIPIGSSINKKSFFSMGFVRCDDHPVTKGLKDRDFQMWNPGHLIVKGVYTKPDSGNFMTLVDSGYDQTMDWTPLFEIYHGKGSFLACQLPLIESNDTEPMCNELLTRIINYLAKPIFRHPKQKLSVLSGARDRILKQMDEIKLEYDLTSKLPDESQTLFIDCSVASMSFQSTQLKKWLTAGGTLFLHKVTPEHKALLEKLTARKVTISPPLWQAFDDRQIIHSPAAPLAGLNNLDLYWRENHHGENFHALWQVSLAPRNPHYQVNYIVSMDGCDDMLFPGGFHSLQVGKGRLVVNQINFEHDKFPAERVKRFLSMVMTNLEIRQFPPELKPSLPSNIRFEPIDISKQANRSFRDPQAGDNAGWLDWGAGADLRSFPTGKTHFQNIPFLVPQGDKNAIFLRSSKRETLANYPADVMIPVNKKNVAGLYFLHTAGWAYGSSPFGERIIKFADGSEEKIRLNENNMADWNPGKDNFPKEKLTTTTVAWEDATPQFPLIRVYKTLWVNPYPEKTIASVTLSNKSLPPKQWRVIPHFGLTAAILQSDKTPLGNNEVEKSERLFQEALIQIEKGNQKTAVSLLEESLKNNPRNTGSWLSLTSIKSQSASIKEFTDLCKRWAKSEPKNYQSFNVLGEFLTNNGNYEDALKAYKISLKIEWNQPFVNVALENLNEKINKSEILLLK
jgi:hypothetical protein